MDEKNLKLPLYQQVKNYIEEKIVSKKWEANSKIPSENELLITLKVSRMTVNRALRELASDGYLERVQGVGTFVAGEKPQTALLKIKSIAEDIKDRGGAHSSKVIMLREERSNPELSQIFGIINGSPLYHSVVLHFDGNIPIQLADRYIEPKIAPLYIEQDFTKITSNEYLLKVAPISEVEHIIEAVMPDKNIQKHLEIEKTDPCLLLNRKTWIGEKVATKSCFYYPGMHYKIGGRFKPSSIAHRIIT
jgi:GntR family histidine utilization transcriptional repressor